MPPEIPSAYPHGVQEWFWPKLNLISSQVRAKSNPCNVSSSVLHLSHYVTFEKGLEFDSSLITHTNFRAAGSAEQLLAGCLP